MLLAVGQLLCGCFSLGPQRLAHDEIEYSRALAESERQQTLLNIVRLRYGESPTFIDLTQIISGYQLQRNATGAFEIFPGANPSNYLGGSASTQMQESPTFTYQPVTGDQFAESFLRPLAPASVLPLALGGLPIDVLFRLVVQSVNSLNNATVLTGKGGLGAGRFYLLLHDLRRLQVAGLLDVRLGLGKGIKEGPEAQRHVYAAIRNSDDPDLRVISAQTRQLLGLTSKQREFEVVYGRAPAEPGQVAILTRSMLGVLGEIGYSADVPDADVTSGRTVQAMITSGRERRPAVVVHSSQQEQADAFVEIRYGATWFWIAGTDFDSKVGFALVQILLALARTTHTPGAVITIPTG